MNGLNAPIETIDGTGSQGARRMQGRNEFLYAYVPASALRGEIYVVTYDGDEETNPKLVTAATLAVYQEYAVILADQGTIAGFAWVQTKGHTYALVEGTTDVAKDDFLKVTNTLKYCVKDATTRSTGSFAISCAAQTANSSVLTEVELIGGTQLTA